MSQNTDITSKVQTAIASVQNEYKHELAKIEGEAIKLYKVHQKNIDNDRVEELRNSILNKNA